MVCHSRARIVSSPLLPPQPWNVPRHAQLLHAVAAAWNTPAPSLFTLPSVIGANSCVFTTAKSWELLKCPAVSGLLNKWGQIYRLEKHAAISSAPGQL